MSYPPCDNARMKMRISGLAFSVLGLRGDVEFRHAQCINGGRFYPHAARKTHHAPETNPKPPESNQIRVKQTPNMGGGINFFASAPTEAVPDTAPDSGCCCRSSAADQPQRVCQSNR